MSSCLVDRRKEALMQRFHKLTFMTSFLIVLSMLLAACVGGTTNNPGPTPASGHALRVALVIIGPVNDGGLNQLAYEGYEKARTQYGFPDEVIATSPSLSLLQIVAEINKVDMVIAIGYPLQATVVQLAKRYPDKKFALVDGCAAPGSNTSVCEDLPNVASLLFKEQEAGCLVGAIAGQMEVDGKSKAPKLLGHNAIGAVGGIPVPAVNRYIAGYKFCAQKLDPSINVVVSYSNNFHNPESCKALALKQIADNRADIIFQVAGLCGAGVLDTADQKGVYSIGVDSDQSRDSTGKVHPSVLTSALKRIDVAVYSIINTTETGNYDSFVKNPTTLDLAHNGVGYADVSGSVPADAKAKADEFAAQIKAGTLLVPVDLR